MVSPVNDAFPSHRPAPLAWKEFRRRSGFNTQPKVYVYDTSPQIVPNSPPISALNLSPLINNNPPVLGVESPRRENSGYFLSHVSQALQVLGASTGGNIAEYIANNFNNEMGVPYEKGRKLHYMVNAILSSPKYKYLFLKDQVLKDEKRSLWRLRNPEENTDEDTVPTDMSLSALIPPTSPCLSLKVSRDEVPVVPTPLSSSSSSIVPTNNNNNNNNNNTNNDKNLTKENYGGGIDDDEKPAGIPRTTEHPPLFASSPISASPTSPDPCSPPLGDTPSLSLSSRRRKRKGLDSSTGIEDKPIEEQPAVEEQKKRRLDLAP